eukprot:gene2732-1717_t
MATPASQNNTACWIIIKANASDRNNKPLQNPLQTIGNRIPAHILEYLHNTQSNSGLHANQNRHMCMQTHAKRYNKHRTLPATHQQKSSCITPLKHYTGYASTNLPVQSTCPPTLSHYISYNYQVSIHTTVINYYTLTK